MKKPVDLAAVRRIRGELRQLVRDHPELTTPEKQARLAGWLADQEEESLTKEPTLTKALHMRITEEDVQHLDHLEAKITIVSRNGIARAALRLGMEQLEKDPTLLLKVQPTRAKR